MVDRNSLRERFSGLSTTELRHMLGSPGYSELAHEVAREILAGRAAQAPSQPCASHANEEVVGTCARCGVFICRACDPAWARVQSGHCPACQARDERPASGMSPRASSYLAFLFVGSLVGVLRLVLHGELLLVVVAGILVVAFAWLVLRR